MASRAGSCAGVPGPWLPASDFVRIHSQDCVDTDHRPHLTRCRLGKSMGLGRRGRQPSSNPKGPWAGYSLLTCILGIKRHCSFHQKALKDFNLFAGSEKAGLS